MESKDANITNFIRALNQHVNVKLSFLTVKKINNLYYHIDKTKKFRGAKYIKSYKRCVFNVEDNFRSTVNQSGANGGIGFLDILSTDDTIDIVNLYRHLNPEDFESDLFNNIMASKNKTNTMITSA